MANFIKSSSSSSSVFVIGTTVLLLLVVINIHGAPVATACSSSSSSQVMLFNSSSVEVVEEVAKEQGITEFAIDDHEIQRRVLQGSLTGGLRSLFKEFTDLIDNAPKPFKATKDETTKLDDIFRKYCDQSCYKSGPVNQGNCACSSNNWDSKGILKYVATSRSCGIYKIYYCCNVQAGCSLCCGTKLDPIINQQGFGAPARPAFRSSGSPPIVYVVVTVIAIFTTISYMFFF